MTKKEKTEENTVEVEIDISDASFLKLARIAHEKDITLNQLCNNLLKDHIKELEKDERNKISD